MEAARFNHTPEPGAEYSAYLYWIAGSGTAHKKIGPAITLKVNAGDTVNAETWVRYENKLSYSRNTSIGAIAALLSGNFSFTSGFEGFTAPQTTTAFGNALTSAGFMGDGSDDERPFAYLNYILFDESMTLVDAGWQRVVDSAGFDVGEEALANRHERVAFEQPIYVPENGYIYIWVSNESEGTKVWFDDVKITHTQITLTQASDYGVWGDVLRELKASEFSYRHGYQGNFSEKDAETGWNHFELREYDPVIGRWTATDPKRVGFSAYLGMDNDPISKTDPDGGCPKCPYPSGGGILKSSWQASRSQGGFKWKASIGIGLGFRSKTTVVNGTGFDVGVDAAHMLVFFGSEKSGMQKSYGVIAANAGYENYNGFEAYHDREIAGPGYGERHWEQGQYSNPITGNSGSSNNFMDETPATNIDVGPIEVGAETNWFSIGIQTIKNFFGDLARPFRTTGDEDDVSDD
jgi:RHS repeat-associated protein